MKLIIVESPAKARTIERFLGPEYRVAASYGHIRDLPGSAKEIPSEHRDSAWARMGVNTDEDFTPIYVVPSGSKKRVAELKKLLKSADELLLATDEDREGEAISWHLIQVLRPEIPVRRIAFHEITKSAVEAALAAPREVNAQLVRAQESRRILDRLYGYSLSPVLWKRIRTKLSAGRVQSVAVRLIVEKEEQRQAFRVAEYWDVEALLQIEGLRFKARLNSIGGRRLAVGKDFDPETGRLLEKKQAVVLSGPEAEKIAAGAQAAQPWHVSSLQRKETRQRPSPPFTTSTLQQAASAKLGLSPQRTMQIAQRLYEGIDLGGGAREGLITYMRTDSVTLSEKALGDAVGHIRKQYGSSYTSGPRRYKTKSKSAQEAHEGIRPTVIDRTPQQVAGALNRQEQALYQLIWSRTVASQMTDAILDKTTIDFQAELDGTAHVFRASGSVVRFAGFLKVHGASQKDTVLPDLVLDQTVGRGGDLEGAAVQECNPVRHETSPPARYTEASLVKKLEEEGIGRPSTYAPIISTIQAREYVVKKSGALLPTYVGMAVVHLMRRHFAQYIDLKFTAKMEEELDQIAAGKIDWIDFLSGFYGGPQAAGDGLLERIASELPRIEFPAIPIGIDPASKEPVTVRIGKTYVYVQVGDGADGRRAALPLELLIDELSLSKALDLIRARARAKEPIGRHPDTGQNIYALIGPYGPYVQLGEVEEGKKPKRASLPKGMAPEEADLEFAVRLLSLPRVVGEDPESGQPILANNGRFGPYVAKGRIFAKLDSQDQIYSITLDEALERIRIKSRKTLIKELGPHPQSGAPMQVLKGRFGPYVTDGTANARLDKLDDPSKVTAEQAVELLASAGSRRRTAGRAGGKKARGKAAKRKVDKQVKKKASSSKPTKKTAKKTAGKKVKKAAKRTAKKRTKKSTGKKSAPPGTSHES